MKILAAPIKRQLLLDAGKRGRCAIYENELQRIWPLNEENRKRKIEQFAKEYGFRWGFYKPGLCAIFEKDTPSPTAPEPFAVRPLRNNANNLEATVARLEATDRQQRKQIEALTAALQKVSARLEINKPARQGSRHQMKLETL